MCPHNTWIQKSHAIIYSTRKDEHRIFFILGLYAFDFKSIYSQTHLFSSNLRDLHLCRVCGSALWTSGPAGESSYLSGHLLAFPMEPLYPLPRLFLLNIFIVQSAFLRNNVKISAFLLNSLPFLNIIRYLSVTVSLPIICRVRHQAGPEHWQIASLVIGWEVLRWRKLRYSYADRYQAGLLRNVERLGVK